MGGLVVYVCRGWAGVKDRGIGNAQKVSRLGVFQKLSCVAMLIGSGWLAPVNGAGATLFALKLWVIVLLEAHAK